MIHVRHRTTEGLSRSRLKLEAKRAAGPLGVVIVGMLVALAGAAYLAANLTSTLGRGTQELRFAVDDATAVVPAVSELRYRGIEAGKITKIEREGTQPVLVVELSTEYGPVYRNARAQLRPKTPLQDIYLDIVDPGTPRAGELGEKTLAEARTETSVNVDDVLAVFEADERTRLRQLLDNLGNGLDDGGRDLRAAIVGVTPFLETAGRITRELSRHERATKSLVHNAAVLTEELGRREVALRTLLRQGSATFGTLQEGSEDLDATLREVAPTFAGIDSSFAAVRGVLGDVDTAVQDLYPVAERLPSALRTVRRLDDSLGPAATRLQRPVGRLVPLTEALVPVSSSLSRSTRALRPQIPAYDKATKSAAGCERAVTGFFQWNASLTKFGDLRGPVPRGNAAFPRANPSGARRPGRNCSGGETILGRPGTEEDQG